MKSDVGLETALEIFLSGPSLLEQRKKEFDEKVEKKRVVVIAGPTACGKSVIGMMLAQAINGEIIAADSMQVYRGMDIGTAKPSLADQALVPHHLIDIRDVTERFNVVDFYSYSHRSFQIIHGYGHIPIAVGGSGFYVHSLLYGPPSGPPSVPELRESLEESLEMLGAPVLYERLQQLDPEYANTITVNDRQKIVRALEIITLTGKKVSKHSWKSRQHLEDFDFRCWFLHRPRESLYQRIEERCERMVKEGLIEEVRALEKAGIRENSSAAHAIGYRQVLDYLVTMQSEDDYKKFMEEFKKASRRYAKRQLTWFRHQEQLLFRWLDLDLHDPETVVDIIKRDLLNSHPRL